MARERELRVLMRRAWTNLSPVRTSPAGVANIPFMFTRFALMMFCAMVCGRNSPVFCLSSVMKHMRFLIASRGAACFTSFPPIRISPLSSGALPKSTFMSSERPEPAMPAMPRISPRRRVNDTSVAPFPVTPRASKITSPMGTVSLL